MTDKTKLEQDLEQAETGRPLLPDRKTGLGLVAVAVLVALALAIFSMYGRIRENERKMEALQQEVEKLHRMMGDMQNHSAGGDR